MPRLQVPGASLSYNAVGSGPFLLLIPGADGCGSVFSAVLPYLSTHFTTIAWDRRGFSGSHPQGSQDLVSRLATDADDAHRLIQHVAQGAPAFVMGTSSGAVVAMNLLVRHPQSVAKLVAHEPPSFSVLPDDMRATAAGAIERIYATYRTHGPAAAMDIFASGLSDAKDAPHMRAAMDGARSDEIRANAMFWFEFELRQYTSAALDIAGLKNMAVKLVPAVGVDSSDGPGVAPAKVIARAVGKEVGKVAGAHLGYVTDAEEWARSLVMLLGY